MKNWILSMSPLFICILLFVAAMIMCYFQRKELIKRKGTSEDVVKDPIFEKKDII